MPRKFKRSQLQQRVAGLFPPNCKLACFGAEFNADSTVGAEPVDRFLLQVFHAMSTAYRPLNTADGFSEFELLVLHPPTLSRFASYCSCEFSGEDLLAFLLLQYIDCRASAGHDVGDEFNVLYRDFIREGADLEVNIPSDVRKTVSGCLFNIPNREFRGRLFDALQFNVGNTWQRYSQIKSNADALIPEDFPAPKTIPGLVIWKGYLDARRILGKGPHPAGPNRVQRLVRKLRVRLGH